ncbi:MAG: NAD-dependent epimerase/dehydratase family protein [Planctomycetes bacterium]|nr:NAD-dependent epimerase/dehydratase family protein [Planctomycetota bacterium]
MRVFITGSSGLIGSELVRHFDRRATRVVGADNNFRADLFGPEGDTTRTRDLLLSSTRRYRHVPLDVRDRAAVARLFREEGPFDLVVHCAAQPSHDLAARRPFDDFDVNATGTLNVLEAVRQHSPDAVFVHMSTNKVYGDAPNELPMVELPTRWDYARPEDHDGVREDMRIDRSKHSLFGASKVAADVLVQEYGRYFGLRTVSLRCGCMTGPDHSAVELHGFLAYLTKAHVLGRTYQIYGYKGKQVRDNLHSVDVALAIEAVYEAPRPGEVYNLGGGRENSCSILEALARLEAITGQPARTQYVDVARQGDHVCYISDLGRFRAHYPQWRITRSLDDIFLELVQAWRDRAALPATVAA